MPLTDAHFRLSQTTIERLDWRKVIERYDRPHTLFYCDPPYWQTEGYGVGFAWEEYEALAKFADEIQGHIVISINDHPDIRALFGHLPCKAVDYEYTVGGTGRSKAAVELIYGNWKGGLPKARHEQQGLF
jgi:DNA adenine methylase